MFLCTHNSARSQIAEAYLNHYHGDRYIAKSAGTHPTSLNPYVFKVMAEDGINISKAKSKNVEEFLDVNFDIVVTVCGGAKESCPIFPRDEIIHHGFRDPSVFSGNDKEVTDQTRMIRDEIKEWIKSFFSDE